MRFAESSNSARVHLWTIATAILRSVISMCDVERRHTDAASPRLQSQTHDDEVTAKRRAAAMRILRAEAQRFCGNMGAIQFRKMAGTRHDACDGITSR
jgi:hypothetical protein